VNTSVAAHGLNMPEPVVSPVNSVSVPVSPIGRAAGEMEEVAQVLTPQNPGKEGDSKDTGENREAMDAGCHGPG